MSNVSETYLPAAGHDWALPLYDPMVRLLGVGPTRQALIDQADIRPSQRVLEVGCGTGSLVVLLKQRHPAIDVVALDPDPRALALARRKAARAVVSIRFDEGFADRMAYPDASFDRVLSSLMFHHLERPAKEQMLREARRVLKPGGSLHLLDLAGPRPGGRGGLTGLLHSSDQLRDNTEERVLGFMSGVGLTAPIVVNRGGMLFGRIRLNYYRASAPPPAGR